MLSMKKKTVVPYNKESLVKSRRIGRIKGELTRNQRIAYNVFLKTAYELLLQNPDQNIFRVGLQEFLDLAGFKYENYHSWLFKDTDKQKSLKTVLKELQTKTYELEWRNQKNEPYKVLSASLLSQFIMDKGKDYIEFAFSPFIRNAILTKRNFYILYLPVIISMKHSYSIALYEQLLQRKDFGIWRVGKEDFRALLGVENKYKTKMFDERVLCPAVSEINKVTNIRLTYKKLKHGRKIVAYEFRWHWTTKQNSSGITLDRDRCIFTIPSAVLQQWKDTYSSLFDVENDIHRAENWLRVSRNKWENRHNDWEKFLSNWLGRTAVDVQAKQNATAKQKKGSFIILPSPPMSEEERKKLDNIEVAEAGEW